MKTISRQPARRWQDWQRTYDGQSPSRAANGQSIRKEPAGNSICAVDTQPTADDLKRLPHIIKRPLRFAEIVTDDGGAKL